MAAPVAAKSAPHTRAMKGPDKAAALLLCMGRPLASRLLARFDTNELKHITRSIAQLGTVPAQMLEVLVEEFAGQFANGVDLSGSPNEVEQMLDGILPPEQLADVMSDVTGNSNHAMWDRLSSVPESVFAGFLVNEHPQTSAFIISKITPACAAKVVGLLPRELRNEIMRRMLSIGPVTESAVRIIQGQLQEDLLSNVSRHVGSDQNARMADIINKMDRNHMEDVMQSLSAARPKAAEILRKLMFTFDDIIKLQPKARGVLFDKIPTELIVLALKGTDSSFRDSILSSLAARARRIVDNELASGGPALQKDVLKARRTIADTALELASGGEIELNSSEDEDEFFD